MPNAMLSYNVATWSSCSVSEIVEKKALAGAGMLDTARWEKLRKKNLLGKFALKIGPRLLQEGQGKKKVLYIRKEKLF